MPLFPLNLLIKGDGEWGKTAEVNGFEDRLDGIGGDTVVARNFRESDSLQQIQKDAVMRSTVRTEVPLRDRDMENFQKARRNHRNTKSKKRSMEVQDEYIVNFCWKKSIYG